MCIVFYRFDPYAHFLKQSLFRDDLLLTILAILYEHLYKTVLPECQRRDEKKPKAGMKSGDVSTNSNSMLGNKGNDYPQFSIELKSLKRLV